MQDALLRKCTAQYAPEIAVVQHMDTFLVESGSSFAEAGSPFGGQVKLDLRSRGRVGENQGAAFSL